MTPIRLLFQIALAAACLVLSSSAESGGLRAPDAYTGLYDPFPQIQHPCLENCGPRHHRRRPHGGDHGGDRDGWGRRDRVLVDCSGQRPRMAHSVQEAVERVDANGTIVILPPGRGVTCYGRIEIHKPLTITSAEGNGPAVLQAPEHSACLLADIHLGDALIIENVTFIARGRDQPCVQVKAGRVVVRHSKIDSRNTEWAFDVRDSGELDVEDSVIETDGSGVQAIRAEVHLKNLEVAVEEGHDGVGLWLDRTDGSVDGGTLIGGKVGVIASSGVHGLKLTGTVIRKAQKGMNISSGEQGTVEVSRLRLQDNLSGITIAPGTDAFVRETEITGSGPVAVALFGGGMRLTNNTIAGGRIGIHIGAADQYRGLDLPSQFHVTRDGTTIADLKPAFVQDNKIDGIFEAGIDIDRGARAIVTGNIIHVVGRGDCVRGADRRTRHANSCFD